MELAEAVRTLRRNPNSLLETEFACLKEWLAERGVLDAALSGGSSDAIEGDESDEEEAPPAPSQDEDEVGTDALARARKALSAGNWERAYTEAETVLRERPNNVSAHRIAGVACARTERYEEARYHLGEAQTMDYDPHTETELREVCTRLRTTARPSETPPPPRNDASAPPVDFASMLRDPMVMRSVESLMKNPEMMSAVANSPLFQSMAGGSGK